jgi:hypothetical protein
MTTNQGNGKSTELEKRPYHRPRLLIYGDVNSLTRAKTLWPTPNPDGKQTPALKLPYYS